MASVYRRPPHSEVGSPLIECIWPLCSPPINIQNYYRRLWSPRGMPVYDHGTTKPNIICLPSTSWGWIQNATLSIRSNIFDLTFTHTDHHNSVCIESQIPGSDHRRVHGVVCDYASHPNHPINTTRPSHFNWQLLPSLWRQLDWRSLFQETK